MAVVLCAQFAANTWLETDDVLTAGRHTEELNNGGNMDDNWCQRYWDGQKWIFGGAARNVRIRNSGGMDSICREIGRDAAQMALDRANQQQMRGAVVPLRRKAS